MYKIIKHIYILSYLIFSIIGLSQGKILLEKPMVDERIELLSIAFRLADAPDYNFEGVKSYVHRIEKHYAPHKNHHLIEFIREIQPKYGIYFDAVMNMAIHLDSNLNPIIPFASLVPDERWNVDIANQFVILLKKFYEDSSSKFFFKQNKSFYKKTSTNFLPLYNKINLNWFESFFGKKPNENFLIVIGVANGRANYGISLDIPNQKRNVYSIVGAYQTNKSGIPVFEFQKYFPTLIHEFSHSFINYLLDENSTPFQESGEQIFQVVKEKMEKLHYGNWQTMLNEALVRASVIKYMKDNNFQSKDIQNEIEEQLKEGFIWIEDLVNELEKYDNDRKKYPTLESYLPKLIEAYQLFAKKMPLYLEKNNK